MKISGTPSARKSFRQREFFDPRRMTHGLCRYYAGDFMEEATASLTGATRLKTDSRRVTCPDLQWTKRQFLESKSVGLTSEAILYKVRLERDAEFCAHGNELFYCFWHHNYKVTKADCKYDLHSKLAAHVQEVLIVPCSLLLETYRDVPAKLLNNALTKSGKILGWGSASYGWGWNVPLKPLASQCTKSSTISKIQVYDVTITDLRVRCYPSIPDNLIALPSIELKASILLEELLSSRLEVAKWPGRFGEGYVRGCYSHNAPWYSEFCKQFERRPSKRFWKPGRTIIKRVDIIRALKKISAEPERYNKHRWKTTNVIRLLDFMEGWTSDWTRKSQEDQYEAYLKGMTAIEKVEHERLLAQDF